MLKRKLLSVAQVLLVFVGVSAASLGSESAKAHIESLGREAIETLTSGTLGESAQRAKFLELLDRGFDVPSIAKYVMGKHWSSLASEQQSSFISKFRGDLSRQYANRFKEYRGVEFHVKGARETGDGGYFVQSYLKKPSESTRTAVEWKVYDSKILDVKVEGVSMSQTKRDEAYAAIQAGGGDAGRYAMGGSAAPAAVAPSGPSAAPAPSAEDNEED